MEVCDTFKTGGAQYIVWSYILFFGMFEKLTVDVNFIFMSYSLYTFGKKLTIVLYDEHVELRMQLRIFTRE